MSYGTEVSKSTFRYDGTNQFGLLKLQTTYTKQPSAGLNGVAGGYSFPFISLNLGGYRGHHLYAGDAYGAPEYGSLGYVGGSMTMERSVMRKGYKSNGSNFTSTFAIYYAKAPIYRTGSNYIASSSDFTYSSTNEAEHNNSTLHIMANTGAY